MLVYIFKYMTYSKVYLYAPIHIQKLTHIYPPSHTYIFKGQLFFTASLDKSLRLFHIDGKQNNVIHRLHVPDLPLTCAAFHPSGSHIVMTGLRSYFYSYDLNSGSVVKIPKIIGSSNNSQQKPLSAFIYSPDGQFIVFRGQQSEILTVCHATSFQFLMSFQMNGPCASCVFSSDSRTLFSSGVGGEVYCFDLRSRRCVSRFIDEGSLDTCALAISHNFSQDQRKNQQDVAMGSSSGIVNLYAGADLINTKTQTHRSPKHHLLSPLKSFGSLTTKVTTLTFNGDGQILALASRELRDSLKLVHVPTQTVIANWPTAQSPLGYVSCVTFSPESGYVAVGNDRGRVLLYRLNHYRSSTTS